MRAKVGAEIGDGRRISAGSPQGSILGCFLYCATTQQLSKDLVSFRGDNTGYSSEPTWHSAQEDLVMDGTESSDVSRGSVGHQRMNLLRELEESGRSASEDEDSIMQNSIDMLRPVRLVQGVGNRILDSSDDSYHSMSGNDSIAGFDNLIEVFKYVDDTTLVETCLLYTSDAADE